MSFTIMHKEQEKLTSVKIGCIYLIKQKLTENYYLALIPEFPVGDVKNTVIILSDCESSSQISRCSRENLFKNYDVLREVTKISVN